MRFSPIIALAGVTLVACANERQEGALFEPAFAAGGGREVHVTLSGASEVPPNTSTATGTFHLTLHGNDELCYTLTASGLSSALTGAHIHRAPAAAAGPIVVPLTPPEGGQSSGCIAIEKALFKELRKSPESFYVNVHTQNYRAGEIRAQLGE